MTLIDTYTYYGDNRPRVAYDCELMQPYHPSDDGIEATDEELEELREWAREAGMYQVTSDS